MTSRNKSHVVALPFCYPVRVLKGAARTNSIPGYMRDTIMVRIPEIEGSRAPVVAELDLHSRTRLEFDEQKGRPQILYDDDDNYQEPIRYRQFGDVLYRPVLMDRDLAIDTDIREIGQSYYRPFFELSSADREIVDEDLRTGFVRTEHAEAILSVTKPGESLCEIIPVIRSRNAHLMNLMRPLVEYFDRRDGDFRVATDLRGPFEQEARQLAKDVVSIDGVVHVRTGGPCYILRSDYSAKLEKSVLSVHWFTDVDWPASDFRSYIGDRMPTPDIRFRADVPFDFSTQFESSDRTVEEEYGECRVFAPLPAAPLADTMRNLAHEVSYRVPDYPFLSPQLRENLIALDRLGADRASDERQLATTADVVCQDFEQLKNETLFTSGLKKYSVNERFYEDLSICTNLCKTIVQMHNEMSLDLNRSPPCHP